MSRPRRLFLHIGLPKTGSSAIQAWLARNAAALSGHGIAYRDYREDAARDRITSGNGQWLLEALASADPAAGDAGAFGERFVAHYFGDCDAAIVSNENLADASPRRLEWFRAQCAAQAVAITVFGYCRTVYDHCQSLYQQRVKRHGETCSFHDYAAAYDNPQCRNLRAWHAVFGTALKIRLYDAVKDGLVEDFVRRAGIDRLGLDTSQGSVNRSLAFAELELLRRLNAWHGGVLSTRLSDALIYASPGREPDYRFDSRIAQGLEQRFAAEVRAVNEEILIGERLSISPRPGAATGDSPVPQSAPPPLDRSLEIILKALSEAAAEARTQERQLRVRLEIEIAKNAMAAEKWDLAKPHLLRALQIDVDNATAHRRLAEVCAKLGDHKAAQTHRKTANRLRERGSGQDFKP